MTQLFLLTWFSKSLSLNLNASEVLAIHLHHSSSARCSREASEMLGGRGGVALQDQLVCAECQGDGKNEQPDR